MSFYSPLSCQMDNVSNLLVPSPTLLSLSLLLCLCLDTEQPLPLAPLKTSQTRRHLPASGSTHAMRKIGPPHCGREGGGGAVLILDPVAGRLGDPGAPVPWGRELLARAAKFSPFNTGSEISLVIEFSFLKAALLTINHIPQITKGWVFVRELHHDFPYRWPIASKNRKKTDLVKY